MIWLMIKVFFRLYSILLLISCFLWGLLTISYFLTNVSISSPDGFAHLRQAQQLKLHHEGDLPISILPSGYVFSRESMQNNTKTAWKKASYAASMQLPPFVSGLLLNFANNHLISFLKISLYLLHRVLLI